jgi:mevalonate kinase
MFIVAGTYTDYKAECSSHYAENTFLCMRLTPRGLTPQMTGMDDRYGTRKVRNNKNMESNGLVTCSAPGKAHLIGEHAVVYGEPAMLISVGKRAYVSAEKEARQVKIHAQDINERGVFSISELKAFAEELRQLWDTCSKTKNFSPLYTLLKNERLGHIKAMLSTSIVELDIATPFSLNIHSDIPIGSGLGSSAALSVAVPKALSELFGMALSLEEINQIAYEIERVAHGTPSGGDNSICCYGGALWFKKGSPNIIEPLRLDFTLKNFVLVFTGTPQLTTGELVSKVRSLAPEYRNPRIKRIGEYTQEMKVCLAKHNFTRMKELMNLAQELLAELGVSADAIDRIHNDVKAINGGAKLSGAGGGGYMVCYHEDPQLLAQCIKELGYVPEQIELGVEGVRIEPK